MVKYHNAQMALDVARTCRDLLGAAGILDEFVTMRHMVNLETVNTYEGTRHVHQLVLGRHLTGISAFE
jgi:glutaryl-CoA dehydrogenase